MGGLQRQIPLFLPKDIESESGCFSREEGSFSAPQYEILQRLVTGLGSKEKGTNAPTPSLFLWKAERGNNAAVSARPRCPSNLTFFISSRGSGDDFEKRHARGRYFPIEGKVLRVVRTTSGFPESKSERGY